MNFLKWNEECVWEREETDIYILNVMNPRGVIKLSGIDAVFWMNCNGMYEVNISELSSKIAELYKNGYLILSDLEQYHRFEIEMDMEIELNTGIFLKNGYGVIISNNDLLFERGAELEFAEVLSKTGKVTLDYLYKKLNFSNQTAFRLVIRRLYKLGLIQCVVPIEQMKDKKTSFRIQFEVTDNCNLKCAHCYDSRKLLILKKEHKEYLLLTARKLLEIAKVTQSKLLLAISGGEPLISPYIWDVMDIFNQNSHLINKVQILTNGTLLTDEKIEKIKQYGFINSVQISLDGITKDTHNEIRGSGVFEKVIDAIGRIKKNSNLDVTVHYVVHKKNLEEAYQLLNFAKLVGIDRVVLTRLVPDGNGKEMKMLMLSAQETNELFHKMSEVYNKERQQGQDKPKLLIERCDWPVTFTEEEKCKPQYNGFSCGIGRNFLDIRSNGDIYGCRRLNICIGNIHKDPIDKIMNHELLWNFRVRATKGLLKGKCSKCKFAVAQDFKHMCSGGAACVSYGYYGELFVSDPQCNLYSQ